ncbi:spermidine/putrescine transport system ATP-binding protein [Tistlia consotensis]|uniref:Spermidine/putrescine transport system ATP-binding protein n=1 Tax=Tistlia consotensis USBA 355 TaxID=560819 RepID=A0A1Y6B8S4_9PROT|nr:ABC transporter ATP-binding protein [Tistlia consotensis]SME96953.1 spermidine/putrescine transport system ATP-binding protein [Tistlia consotensis USBA 355]SNR56362.1 spermidine/putrescine transport system ATP-binding protein [Tistlia consotensis]
MHGKNVELDKVVMRFGGFTAVQQTSLEIRAGEFFSILGPSGCGKTTILRMVSGFIEPSEGRVRIGGDDMGGRGPARRPTALIFQNLALFPLMSNWENVAFGLEARGLDKRTRRERAYELLALVGLEGKEAQRPGALSGGQRQRVAIARALAVEPAVLLLDEPLSALDLKLRQYMRAELKAIQRKTGVTFIFITHDQGEALTMSDRIAVMRAGVVEQVGTTDEIYDRPATPFVATFVGENNVLSGTVAEADAAYARIETPLGPVRARNQDALAAGQRAMVFVRPERASLVNGHDLDNRLTGRFERRDLEGSYVNLFFTVGDQPFIVHEPNLDRQAALEGEVRLGFQADDAVAMRAGALDDA